MPVLYRTAGRAAEYAPWAVNLYETCPHGCRYCYVPHMPAYRARGVSAEQFHQAARPRPDIIERLAADTRKIEISGETVLLCFGCDPYPNSTGHGAVTRTALLQLAQVGARVAVLTKGGMLAVRDFEVMREFGMWFGQTVAFTRDADQERWEPGAAGLLGRMLAAESAHDKGIKTWISIEPVIDPDQSLEAIQLLMPYVDHFKIGKLNGRDAETRQIERSIDWRKFTDDVQQILRGYELSDQPGAFVPDTYYLKKSLTDEL